MKKGGISLLKLFDLKKKDSTKGTIDKKEYDENLILEIQPQGNVSFTDERFIWKGDGYEACIHVYKFPSTVNDFWLERILNLPYVISTLDVSTEDKEIVFNSLKKSLGEQKSRIYSEKDEMSKDEAIESYQEMKDLASTLRRDGEVVKKIHLRLFVSARTQQDIETRVKDILTMLEGNDFKASIFMNEQKYEWQSLLTSFQDQSKMPNKRYGQVMPSETLSAGYPFHFTYLDDPQGQHLGYSFTGGVVNFDLFHKDNKRLFYNGIVVGGMGSGKSTTLKKLLKMNAIVGNTIRVLDVVGEFEELVLRLGGKAINLDGSDGIINPLQVLATAYNEDTGEIDIQVSFSKHISKLIMMYQFISPDCTTQELQEYERLLLQFYRESNLDLNQITNYKAKDYPIFKDFYKFVENEYFEDVSNKIIRPNITSTTRTRMENILLSIDSLISTYGAIFNGHSTIEDITNEQIISFKLRNLLDMSKPIFLAQLFNVFTLVWDNALKQGTKEKSAYENKQKHLYDITRYLMIIDEFHNLTNSDNPIAVEYLNRYAREARKYFGGLLLATQSLRDVAPEHASNETQGKVKELFTLTQYRFIMKQETDLIPDIHRTFGDKLSESEIHLIPRLGQGQCILSVSGTGNIGFEVFATEDELALFKGGA